MSIADYAQSSRSMSLNFVEANQKTFYDKLLYFIVMYRFNFFIDDFSNYAHIRLKLALSTRDFSCVELIMWVCYKFLNDKNVSKLSKSEIKMFDFLKHKFLSLPREYRIISPIQKFSGHKNIISQADFYSSVNFKNLQGHLIDYTFMLEHFKNIALIDDNIQMKPYYNIKDLQRFETLPDEVKKVVQPLRELGCI